jgi:very-short-patch-repair endonuclease
MRATANSMRTARQQRRSMSPPEVKLWALLRRSPAGIRFRRQHPIGPFVADFYCPAAKLVIEIDGMVHDNANALLRDKARDDYLQGLGLKLIRIPAAEVLADPGAVAEGLVRLCGPSTAQLR